MVGAKSSDEVSVGALMSTSLLSLDVVGVHDMTSK